MTKILDYGSEIQKLVSDADNLADVFEGLSLEHKRYFAEQLLKYTSEMVTAAELLDPEKFPFARHILLNTAGVFKTQASLAEKILRE